MSNSPHNYSALALSINEYTHLSHIINPSSQVGPEPIEIPVTGYSIVAEMVCRGKIDFKILGFRAEVIQQTSFQSDSITKAIPPTPNVLFGLPPEEEERVRKEMQAFIPLELPHFEILLDKHPPIIRPALKADGLPACSTPQLPFTLHPGEHRRFLLAPVTHSPELTMWSLHVIWEFEGKRQESPYGIFQVTGYTGFMAYSPHAEPRPLSANEITDHWPYNPAFSNQFMVFAHGGKDGIYWYESSEAFNHRLTLLIEQQRLDEALTVVEDKLRANPSCASLHFNKGVCLLIQDRPIEALTALEQGLQIEPECLDALWQKCIALIKLNHGQEALPTLDLLHQRGGLPDPQVTLEMQRERTNLLLEAERYDDAVGAIDEILRINPDHPAIRSKVAVLLLYLNRPTEALSATEHGIRYYPKDPFFRTVQARALAILGRFEEALAAAEQGLHLAPNDAHVEQLRDALLAQLGKR